MLLRLCLIALLACAACRASDDPSRILRRIQANVLGHVRNTMNYMCVQSVERSYFEPEGLRRRSCDVPDPSSKKELVARDRLRLDVAVSQDKEIYSWHADNKFSSTLINQVVRRGPIATGGFVGFLANIFDNRGVRFYFKGRATSSTGEVFSFDYSVPLSASHYEVGSPDRKGLVPFHGSFFARTASYELTMLTVIADKIPADIGICSARSDMSYQLVPVAGNALLLPREWVLGISTPLLSTESRNEYTSCREFTGESTIHFRDLADAAEPAAAARTLPVEDLPAGITLRVRLRTPVDGQLSYTGDPVEGELLNPITAAGQIGKIPRGATLYGVITRLEAHYKPSPHYFLAIQFDRMRSGDRTFVLRARPEPSENDLLNLRWVYGGQIPELIAEVKRGLFVISSRHLHLSKRFSAKWVTEPLASTQ